MARDPAHASPAEALIQLHASERGFHLHEDVATTQRYLAADEVAPEQDRKTVKKLFAAFGD